MPTVRLAFSAEPQYVRTARLVAVAVARRAGVAEATLDEVRQAIGEACGRAVARHRRYLLDELVQVEMVDDGPYTVRVIDAGPSAEAGADTHGGGYGSIASTDLVDTDDADSDSAEEDADRMAVTLLAGLVDDLKVDGGEVRMAWPVRRRVRGNWVGQE